MNPICLTASPLDPAATARLVQRPGHGALLVFTGVTRDTFDGRPVLELSYEAYVPLAMAELAAIVSEAEARWPGVAVAVAHRLGVVARGEASVVIAVGSAHRAEGYEASRFTIDELKRRVPIWKKEVYADGSAWKANAPAPDGGG